MITEEQELNEIPFGEIEDSETENARNSRASFSESAREIKCMDYAEMVRRNLSLFNANGLRKGVTYVFNEDGTVNWRAMIPPKYLYQNKQKVNRKIADLTEKGETVNPEWLDGSIEGLADSELLITLPGIKWLADLRGYSSVSHNPKTIEAGFATDTCSITWKGIFETDFQSVTFSDSANCIASGPFSNCAPFWGKFAECLAANRAFIRAVRGFLKIEVYGGDEMSPEEEKKDGSLDNQAKQVIELIAKAAEEKGVGSYTAFLKLPEVEGNAEFARFKKFGELPPKLRYAALNILKGIQ